MDAEALMTRPGTRPLLALCLAAAAAAAGLAQPADLPSPEMFLREAREAFARSQEVWHRYTYKERSAELRLNPFGRMGMGPVRVFEVRPSPNPKLTYRRMIERNGIAVPDDELRRQDAEYEARVSRLASRTAAGIDDGERRRAEDMLARKRAQMIADDVVDTLEFDLVRREYREGRPMIVVSFAAKPHARPVTREGRLASVFRGELRIDEASREIVDLKAVAIDDVAFGGFIAKVYKGTEAAVERREIEPGVSMPTRLTLTGEVRALFRTTRIDHVVEWFDYRPIGR